MKSSLLAFKKLICLIQTKALLASLLLLFSQSLLKAETNKRSGSYLASGKALQDAEIEEEDADNEEEDSSEEAIVAEVTNVQESPYLRSKSMLASNDEEKDDLDEEGAPQKRASVAVDNDYLKSKKKDSGRYSVNTVQTQKSQPKIVLPGVVSRHSQRSMPVQVKAMHTSEPKFSLVNRGTFSASANFPEYSELMQDSEHAIRKLENDLASQEKKLEQLAQQRLEDLKTRVEQEIVSMRESAEKAAIDLSSNLKEEALKLRHAAARKTLGIISEAEEKALAFRREKRLKTFEESFGKVQDRSLGRYALVKPRSKHRLMFSSQGQMSSVRNSAGSGERVSPEWKNDISRQFYSDMAYMKSIILRGETPGEVRDFNRRFTEQNRWFDTTLRSVRFVNDNMYEKVVSKQKRLNDLIMAQKNADKYFKRLSKGFSFSPKQVRKIRLMVLYDLNSTLQKSKHKKVDMLAVQEAVKKTVEEFSVKFKERSGQFPDVKIMDSKTTPVVPIMAQRLQEELDEMQAKLDETERRVTKERKKGKKFLRAAKKKLEEKAKQQTKMELKISQQQHRVVGADKLRREALAQAKQSFDQKMNMAKRLESSTKKNIEMEIELQQAEQKVALADKKAARELGKEFADKLEYKEKENLELNALLRRVSDKAKFFEHKAKELVGKSHMLRTKHELARREVDEAKSIAKREVIKSKNALAKAKASEDLANTTIASINNYLDKQKDSLSKIKKDLFAKEKRLLQAQKELQTDRDLVQKERDGLLAHKQVLRKEQSLLEGLKKETHKLVESSMRMSDDNMSNFLKIRQDAEFELRKMQDQIKQELYFVRKELSRIKHEGTSHVLNAQSKLKQINTQLKDSLHKKNVVSIEEELKKRRKTTSAGGRSARVQNKMHFDMPVERESFAMPDAYEDFLSEHDEDAEVNFDNSELKDPGMPGLVKASAKMPGV